MGRMLHMDHRAPGTAPMPQQRLDAFFGLRVITPPQLGVMNAFLLINHDQRRVLSKCHNDRPKCFIELRAPSITYSYSHSRTWRAS